MDGRAHALTTSLIFCANIYDAVALALERTRALQFPPLCVRAPPNRRHANYTARLARNRVFQFHFYVYTSRARSFDRINTGARIHPSAASRRLS